MKTVLKVFWRWSWLVTLPVVVALVYLGWNTYHRYRTFGVEYNAAPLTLRLGDVGREEFHRMTRGLSLQLLPPGEDGAVGGLRSIQLFAAESDLAKLDSHLPYSGFEFVDASLWYEGQARPVKLRYRGDFLPHWAFHKKSLRVKTKKSDLFEGMRAFNLIVPKFPEQLNNYLSYRLASLMGLIAPRAELVNVVLNGKLQGMSVLVEQLEELTLRAHGRMPGDLYSGELIARDRFEGTTCWLFDLPELWEKIAVNNHFDLASKAPLKRLSELLKRYPDEAAHEELSRLLDMEEWGRFAAFELLTQTHHYDQYHNWRLYYDPWRTSFCPVVWDPVGWQSQMRPKEGDGIDLDLDPSLLHAWLLMNGDFLRARHRAIEEFFSSGKDQQFLRVVDEALASASAALKRDPNIRPLDPGEISDSMTEFRAFIHRVFRELPGAYLGTSGAVCYVAPQGEAATMAIEVTGRTPVDEIALAYARPLDRPPKVRLRYLQQEEWREIDLSGGVTLRGNTVRIPATVHAQLAPFFRCNGVSIRNNRRRVVPAHYELIFDGLPVGNELLEVSAVRGGMSVLAERVDSLAPAPLGNLFRFARPLPLAANPVWRGEVRIDGVREIHEPVVIEPGTRIRLGPGAALIFFGRVLAEATAEHPIVFERAVPDQDPWGAVIVKGRGADGTLLRHCEFRGGSGLKEPLAEYSAMLSVHDVQGVRVRDCRFRDNHVVDDMVHAVYSSIDFEGCVFENALFDALDVDICTGVLTGCRFVNAGNDGLDMMTSSYVVADSVFEGSGDKGISVGEGSQLLAINVVLERCNIGAQAKDGSFGLIYNADFVGNNKALDAYKKNWRYGGGGTLFVHKSVLSKNAELITADKDSYVKLADSYADGRVAVKRERVVTQAVDSKSERKARSRAKLPLPNELTVLGHLAGPFWSRKQPAARGATSRGR